MQQLLSLTPGRSAFFLTQWTTRGHLDQFVKRLRWSPINLCTCFYRIVCQCPSSVAENNLQLFTRRWSLSEWDAIVVWPPPSIHHCCGFCIVVRRTSFPAATLGSLPRPARMSECVLLGSDHRATQMCRSKNINYVYNFNYCYWTTKCSKGGGGVRRIWKCLRYFILEGADDNSTLK